MIKERGKDDSSNLAKKGFLKPTYKRANTNVAKASTGKLFAGDRGFDPQTIILQILALQASFYASLTFCIILVDLICGLRPHT